MLAAVRPSATRGMTRNKSLAGLAMVFFLSGCDSFKIPGQFQSGHRAFLAKKYEESLAFFQKVAQANPNYTFESGLYRQGIWNYVGRAQYYSGKLLDARQSLERALAVYQDDHLARLYLGLTRGRSGDSANGLRDIENGMKGLYAWLEYYESSKPFEAFWDPGREIRSTIEKELKLISANKIDWPQLIPDAEWLGQRFEDEIDQVRRQESRQKR
jgi:tetratricopeptide (TPR) repeat protein